MPTPPNATPLVALAIALVVIGRAGAARAGGEPLTLAELVDVVEERGPEARASLAEVDLARAEVRAARMVPNPTLSLSGGRAEPVFAASVGFRLPFLGQRSAAIAAAEASATQARASSTATRFRLRRDARLAYYAAARAVEAVRVAEAIELLTRRIAAMAEERFEAGAGNRLDAEQGRLVHVRAEQAVSDRRAEQHVAALSLARLLGDPSAVDRPLVDALGPHGATPSLSSLLDGARAHHPELRALAAEREAALARRHAARMERVPTPLVELGLEVLDPSTCSRDPSATAYCLGPRAGLSLDLPVLNLNAGPIARAEAEAQLAAVRAEVALARVETAVRASFAALSAAEARAKFFDESYLPAANRVEAMAREAYSAGHAGLLPAVEAARAVLEAEVGRADALYDVQAARADLEEAAGVALSLP